MPILPVIVISIIAFVTIFLTVPRFRRAMINYAQTAWYYLAGTWNDMNIPHPTWEQARHALFVLLMIILGFLATGIALWGIIIAVMSFFGNMVNAPIAGFLIGLLGFILLIIFPRRSLKIIVSLMVAVFLLAVAHFSLGVFDPEVKKSVDRKTQNWKQEIANSLDKRSVQSESESGIFPKVLIDIVLCNATGQPLKELKPGIIVRALSLNGTKANKNSEGMQEIMLPDPYGRYTNGLRGFVPTRVLDFDWMERERKEKEKPKPPHATSVPSYQPVPTPQNATRVVQATAVASPATEKPIPIPNLSGIWKLSWRGEKNEVRASMKGKTLTMSSFYNRNGRPYMEVVYRCTLEGNCCKGTWETFGEQRIFGTFQLTFSPTGKSGNGLFQDGSGTTELLAENIF